MIMTTRRGMLAMGGGALALATLGARVATARALGLPVGVQLWTVKEELAKDPAGTLKAIRALGYERVETAGYLGGDPGEFGRMIRAAGLDPLSAHHSLKDLMDDTDGKIAAAKAVGAKYVVASSPAPSRPMNPNTTSWPHAVAEAMTLADWRSNAEAMNRIGRKANAAGLRFGYHNHSAEFLEYDGLVAYDEIARITDPSLVVFELDLGWVAGAGRDPAATLTKHGARTHLLHVKDIQAQQPAPGTLVDDETTVPIGSGTIAWEPVFAAARNTAVRGYFVEQEPPFSEPPLEALKKSIAYLNTLKG